MAVEILKPRSDKREYRRIVLPNSLEALLVSDPDTDKAAASMNVAVGSYHNPEGLEGLAHFLEHMLFYASEKYPQEGSYMKFVAEHGGSTNAFTAAENTNFHFDVNTDCFEEALDRFAQFFICPLMSPDATSREINAVDSENRKNLLSDGWRFDQLQKHLSSEDHPFHKFSTGNWDTLDAVPKSNGIDVREELINFYKENYSSSLMHLVVYGKGSLDEIENLVEKKFQAVPNTGRNQIHFKGHPCRSEHLQIIVKAVPIKQGHKLRILWPITPSIKKYKEGPCRYLGHLIGHEGEGSLFFGLKSLGWAISLGAGEVDQSDDFSFFSVVIELTNAGHDHVEEIIGLLFRYISVLQKAGVQRWIFDEIVAISETRFHYQDKVRPLNFVVHIASNMQIYPPEDWLVGSSIPCKFDLNVIQAALDELTPSNVRDDSGIRGLQFIIQSTVKDPSQLNARVDAFLEIFERKLYEMTGKEYQSNVNALIDMKLEKHKNLGEESYFYWREIDDGMLKFDRQEAEVAALRDLTQQELIEFFNVHVKVGAPRRKAISIQVYGGRHSTEYKMAKNETNQIYRIDDIFSFRRSRPLYGSFKGGLGQMKL